MLSNYLKITIAVLLRRKFLSFVNLFGATLTLTVLVVAVAIFESVVSPAGAQHRQARILTIANLSLTNSAGNMRWTAGPGMAFYERYIAPLETPAKISYATWPGETTSYVDGRRITSQLRRTDAAYWEILDFEILAGRVLSADDVAEGRFVAVVNEATALAYFPDRPALADTLGESIVVDSDSYEIIGVVANEPETSQLAYADVWVPLTTAAGYRDQWIEGGHAMLYVEDRSRLRAAQREYQTALESFEYTVDPTLFDTAISAASTSLELVASVVLEPLYDGGAFSTNRVAEFVGVASVATLLFMLLPAINMANLNIGRILERAPEIGLRKAAGASTRVLVGQFIFENVVLALLGGLLAFAIAPLVLGVVNETVFTYGRLTLNVPVLAAGLALIVVFGIVSGAYPAWRMAKLEPAAALRGIQHV